MCRLSPATHMLYRTMGSGIKRCSRCASTGFRVLHTLVVGSVYINQAQSSQRSSHKNRPFLNSSKRNKYPKSRLNTKSLLPRTIPNSTMNSKKISKPSASAPSSRSTQGAAGTARELSHPDESMKVTPEDGDSTDPSDWTDDSYNTHAGVSSDEETDEDRPSKFNPRNFLKFCKKYPNVNNK